MILIKITNEQLIGYLSETWLTDGDREDKYFNKVLDIHKQVEEVLTKCPDVHNLSRLRELRKEAFEPFSHHGDESGSTFLPESTSFLSFDVFLPKAERKFAFEVRYHERVIEKGHILYNGKFFLAYANIDEDESVHFFGQEIREFLKNVLKTDCWEAVVVPPCPLIPDIFLETSPEADSLNIQTDDDDDITISLPCDVKDDPKNLFHDFLIDIYTSVDRFLSASTLNQELFQCSWKIESTLRDIPEDYEYLFQLPWYKVRERFEVMNSIRQYSVELQLLSNEFAVTELKLKAEQESFSSRHTKRWQKTPFRRYFYENFRIPAVSLTEIRETVRHMNDIVSNKYLHYYTVLAAILGGIIGALLTNLHEIAKHIRGFFVP